ncbi:MAG TPA: tetratricopeptide repeat protein [Bryobacteraceae bacterium]|nr:tetratricopeptide repeat protein [Bryobacteraceae bacterium]
MLLFTPVLTIAQLHPGDCSVSGQLTGRHQFQGTVVELASKGDAAPVRTFPNPMGEFQYERLAPGKYELSVATLSGDVLSRRPLQVREQNTRISVELPPAATTAPGSGTVSIRALSRKPDGRAVKEFRKAARSIERGDLDDAVIRLRKAVDADPGYAEAYINLGSCYADLKRYPEAVAEFRIAVGLEPHSATARSNFGHALLALGRFDEAQVELRQAVRLEPETAKHHYLLGLALRARANNEEALAEFERAAPSVPLARVYAAELLSRFGRTREAARSLRGYLETGTVANRAALESWLQRLEN